MLVEAGEFLDEFEGDVLVARFIRREDGHELTGHDALRRSEWEPAEHIGVVPENSPQKPRLIVLPPVEDRDRLKDGVPRSVSQTTSSARHDLAIVPLYGFGSTDSALWGGTVMSTCSTASGESSTGFLPCRVHSASSSDWQEPVNGMRTVRFAASAAIVARQHRTRRPNLCCPLAPREGDRPDR